MSYSGIDSRLTYCPVCGNNIFNLPGTQGSTVDYRNGIRPYIFYCHCGWNGPDNELLNEKNYKQKTRKKKLKRINDI